MIVYRSIGLFMLLSIIIFYDANAQNINVSRDLGMWTNVTLKKTIAKQYTFSIAQILRLQKDIQQLDLYSTDIGCAYHINKKFTIASNIRYNINEDYENIRVQNFRYNIDFSFKPKLGKYLTLKYRLRYQKEFGTLEEAITSNLKYHPALRHKLSLQVRKLKKHKPYISAEVFRIYKLYRVPYYKKYRIKVGYKYELSQSSIIELALGCENRMKSLPRLTKYITSLTYTHKL